MFHVNCGSTRIFMTVLICCMSECIAEITHILFNSDSISKLTSITCDKNISLNNNLTQEWRQKTLINVFSAHNQEHACNHTGAYLALHQWSSVYLKMVKDCYVLQHLWNEDYRVSWANKYNYVVFLTEWKFDTSLLSGLYWGISFTLPKWYKLCVNIFWCYLVLVFLMALLSIVWNVLN